MDVNEALARARAIIAANAAKKLAAAKQAEADVGMQRAVALPTAAPLSAAIGGISWNEEQKLAIDMGYFGKSFCLIGSAGTGKTTTLKGMLLNLLSQSRLPPLETSTNLLVASPWPGAGLA
jgi:hypothetical protein